MTDVCVTGRLKCLTDVVWFGKRPHVPMVTTLTELCSTPQGGERVAGGRHYRQPGAGLLSGGGPGEDGGGKAWSAASQ